MDRGPDRLWQVVADLEGRMAIVTMGIVTLVAISVFQFTALVVIGTAPRPVYVVPGARVPGTVHPETTP